MHSKKKQQMQHQQQAQTSEDSSFDSFYSNLVKTYPRMQQTSPQQQHQKTPINERYESAGFKNNSYKVHVNNYRNNMTNNQHNNNSIPYNHQHLNNIPNNQLNNNTPYNQNINNNLNSQYLNNSNNKHNSPINSFDDENQNMNSGKLLKVPKNSILTQFSTIKIKRESDRTSLANLQNGIQWSQCDEEITYSIKGGRSSISRSKSQNQGEVSPQANNNCNPVNKAVKFENDNFYSQSENKFGVINPIKPRLYSMRNVNKFSPKYADSTSVTSHHNKNQLVFESNVRSMQSDTRIMMPDSMKYEHNGSGLHANENFPVYSRNKTYLK